MSERATSKRQAQMKVLASIAAGATVKEAMKAAGRSEQGYYEWVKFDPSWRGRAHNARDQFRKTRDRGPQRRSGAQGQKIGNLPFDMDRKVELKDFSTFGDYLIQFRLTYFGMQTFPHHQLIIDAMEAAGPGSTTMILIPPEWGKTTLLEDYICARLCATPNRRIALISEAQDLARKSMSRIQRRMDDENADHSLLIGHYGPFKPPAYMKNKPWNADQMTLSATDHDERDPTIATAGIKTRIRGARWDEVILDDVQSVLSIGETARILDIYRTDIVTRPGKSGRKFIIGSRVDVGDFYEAMMDLDLIDELVRIPALDLNKPVGQQSNFPPQHDENGVPVVLASGEQLGWSDQDLDKRRIEVGKDAWARVYMQQPRSKAGAMVSEDELLSATSLTRRVGEMAGITAIGSLDPALARHAAFTICGYDSEKLYVVDVVDLEAPRRNEVLFAEIERLSVRYNPTHWVLENNTLQSGLLVDDRFLELRDRFGFRAISHHTGAGKKLDDMMGIPSLMNAIINHEVEFPFAPEGHHGLSNLFEQLIEWRQDIPTRLLVQDAVMSLWFAFVMWRRLREQLAPDTSAWRRQGMTSPTLYGYAQSNLELQPPEPRLDVPLMTYEQKWFELAGRSS